MLIKLYVMEWFPDKKYLKSWFVIDGMVSSKNYLTSRFSCDGMVSSKKYSTSRFSCDGIWFPQKSI